MRWAEPLVPTAQRALPEVLSVERADAGVPRPGRQRVRVQVREATPPHAPANLDAVKQAVQDDVRTKLAFELAVAAAKKLQEAAAQPATSPPPPRPPAGRCSRPPSPWTAPATPPASARRSWTRSPCPSR